jgi:hypothetical protein
MHENFYYGLIIWNLFLRKRLPQIMFRNMPEVIPITSTLYASRQPVHSYIPSNKIRLLPKFLVSAPMFSQSNSHSYHISYTRRHKKFKIGTRPRPRFANSEPLSEGVMVFYRIRHKIRRFEQTECSDAPYYQNEAL